MFYGANSTTIRTAAMLRKNMTLSEIFLWKKLKDKNEESSEYDSNRTAELNRIGLKVIRFTNDEVIYNLNSVITTIQRAIDKISPL